MPNGFERVSSHRYITGMSIISILHVHEKYNVYSMITGKKKRFLNSITFTTEHNIYVIAGDFKVSQSDIEKE